MKSLCYSLTGIFVSIFLCSCSWYGVKEQKLNVGYGGRAIAIAIDPFNDNIVWAALPTGGLYKTVTGGTIWRPVKSFPEFDCSDIEVCPTSADIIAVTVSQSYSKTRGGIWLSRDGGNTWLQPPSSIRDVNGKKVKALCISFLPISLRMYAGTEYGLAISKDLGVTWSFIDPVPNKKIAIKSILQFTSGKVITFGDDGIWMSDDGETKWYKDKKEIPYDGWGTPGSLARSPLNADHIFLQLNFGHCVYSTDGGNNWTDFSIGLPLSVGARQPYLKMKDTENSNEVDLYCSNLGSAVVKTITWTGTAYDFSKSWKLVALNHEDPSDLEFSKLHKNIAYASHDGGVEKSVDGGKTWAFVGSTLNGFNAIQIHDLKGVKNVLTANDNHLYFGTQDNSLWASADNGDTWPHAVDNEGDNIEAPNNYNPALNNGNYNVSFCYLPQGIPTFMHSDPFYKNQLPTDVGIGSSEHAIVYIHKNTFLGVKNLSETKVGLFVSNDGCVSWSTGPIFEIDNHVYNYLQVSGNPDNPSLIIPFYNNLVGLIRVDNLFDGVAGNEQHGMIPLPQKCVLEVNYPDGYIANIVSFAVDPNDPRCILIFDRNAGDFWITYDSGAGWIPIPYLKMLVTKNDEYNLFYLVRTIAFDPSNSNHIVIGTEQTGLFVSLDRGLTWEAIVGSDKIPHISGFFFSSEDEGWASSYGRGLWKVSLKTRRINNRFVKTPVVLHPGFPTPGDMEMAERGYRDVTAPLLFITNMKDTAGRGFILSGAAGRLVGTRWFSEKETGQLSIFLDGKKFVPDKIEFKQDRFEIELPVFSGEGIHEVKVELTANEKIIKTALINFNVLVSEVSARD